MPVDVSRAYALERFEMSIDVYVGDNPSGTFVVVPEMTEGVLPNNVGQFIDATSMDTDGGRKYVAGLTDVEEMTIVFNVDGSSSEYPGHTAIKAAANNRSIAIMKLTDGVTGKETSATVQFNGIQFYASPTAGEVARFAVVSRPRSKWTQS